MTTQAWLLPEGIEELLPEEAAGFEALRRDILDLYFSWGYSQVNTPLVEFLDSLLTGSAKKLDKQTFKLTDQVSGRLMGVRADITPQLARIDARDHSNQADLPTRLCYVGSVLRARSEDFASSRNPTQIGVELYGHYGVNSDVEVLALMCETIFKANVKEFNIDLGHVGIYRGLAEAANLSEDQESALFEMMQRKAMTEIKSFVIALDTTDAIKQMLITLPELVGGIDVLQKAKQALKDAPESVLKAIEQLQQIAEQLSQRIQNISLHIDLAELRGYGYKTGFVFAAFLNGHGREVARGGRYDGVGARFGRDRAATGFSVDLKTLVKVSGFAIQQENKVLAPPVLSDQSLITFIDDMRKQGYLITEALDDSDFEKQTPFFSNLIIKKDTKWQIKKS